MGKSNFVLASLVSLLTMGALPLYAKADPAAPKPVTVDGGKIQFTGSVVSAPCVVDNDTESQMVNLGQIAANSLGKKGSTGSPVGFNIKLTGCDLTPPGANPTETANYTKASIVFNGAPAGDDSTTLSLNANGSGESVAKNVGIQISQNNVPVKINGSTATNSSNLHVGSNLIPFAATYVATGDAVVAGSANAVVNFSVNYE